MKELITFLQNYGIGIVVIMNCVWMVILIICLRKISKIKKKLEQVTACVQSYINAVMDEEGVDDSPGQQRQDANAVLAGATAKNSVNTIGLYNIEETEMQENQIAQLKEQQNRLISTVLEEIFP